MTASLEGVRWHFTVTVLLCFEDLLTRLSLLDQYPRDPVGHLHPVGPLPQGWTFLMAMVRVRPRRVHAVCRHTLFPASPTSYSRQSFLPQCFQRNRLPSSPTHASHNVLFTCHTIYQQQTLLCALLICKTSYYFQPGRLTLVLTMAQKKMNTSGSEAYHSPPDEPACALPWGMGGCPPEEGWSFREHRVSSEGTCSSSRGAKSIQQPETRPTSRG